MRWISALGALALSLLIAHDGAAGTLSCTRTARFNFAAGDGYQAVGTCTFSSSYATGGDVFGSAGTAYEAGGVLCGSGQQQPLFVHVEAEKAGRLVDYNHTTFKLQAYEPTQETGVNANRAGAEVTAATNLSTIAVRYLAICR